MLRSLWCAVCTITLVVVGLPAAATVALPAPADPWAGATIVRTLGSGRDAAGDPVETTGAALRTAAGDLVSLGGAGGVGSGQLHGSSPDVLARPAAAAPRAGTHSAYLVRIDDAAATGEPTAAEGRAGIARGAAYWRAETGGIVDGITVRGEATLATDDVCSELRAQRYAELWARAEKLFRGLDALATPRTHLVVLVPSSCFDDGSIPWTGLATVGAGLSSGGLVLLVDLDAHTVAHELGHNFGLGHANLVTELGYTEYGGVHSVMGAPPVGGVPFTPPALDPAYREVLGILPASAVTVGRPGVDTTIRAVTRTGVVALRFSDLEGTILYAELRDGSGRDEGTFYASEGAGGPGFDGGPGVRISALVPDANDTPTLLTVGHVSGGSERLTLRAGEHVVLASARRTVSVRSISGGRATLRFSAPSGAKVRLGDVSVRYGRRTKVSARVTASSVPQGTVTFFVGKRAVATARLDARGRATATLPADVRPGRRVVTARYEGDVMLAVSRARRTVKVAKGRPSLTVTKASKVRRGAAATLTVRVGTVAGTAPSGTVRARVGDRDVSRAAKVVRSGRSWVAKVRTRKLPRGKVRLVYTPARKVAGRLATTSVSSGRTAR